VKQHAHPTSVAAVLLVHGAGTGPWIFEGWSDTFPPEVLHAVDLHEGVDVGRASMADYQAVMERFAASLSAPVAVIAWSMGGLVAMMAAEAIRPACLVLLEPSAPAEIQGHDPGARAEEGTFDPEEVYGRFPVGFRSRLESSKARAERKAGISVPLFPCPSVVVATREFSQERGRLVAEYYGSQELTFPDLDHWDLVTQPHVRTSIAAHLGF
jgi:pimeloyl-ACP methyl ester carboxylesterase